MTGVDYGNDAAYEVEYTFDRLGRRATVTDAVGTRTFGYNDGMQLETETIDGSSGGLYSKVITRKYQTTGDAKGRDLGFQVGTDQDPDQDYDVTYHYDDQGRFARITGPGLPAYGVQYERLKDEGVIVSELVAYARYMSGSDPGTDTLAQTQRAYEGTRDLIDYVENKAGSSLDTVSKYDYTNDNLGRRTSVVNTGTAFAYASPGRFNAWRYNDRSELTDSRRGAGTTVADPPGTEITAERRLYDYDNIGNRETDTEGAATPPGTRYTTNALNQYTMTRGFVESFVYDADGNMTKSGLAAGDFDADGDIDAVDFNVFQNCFNGPNNPPKAACTTLATDIDGDGDVDSADFSLFQGCYNGPNRPPKCNAGVRPTQYTWDAENRLTEVRPIIPQEGEKKATFAYDYMGRRVQKQVYNRSSSAWVLESDVRFVYDQWNVVMVVDDEGEPQKKYTWGLDLSGLSGLRGESGSAGIHGAGGIGGLLAVEETATENSPTYWFFHDGNGNVGQLLQYTPGSPPTIALAARYEYDPYGNVIGPDEDADGQWQDDATAYALAQPYRFSTKPYDTETGTYYYIFRLYWPRLGRWGSRDVIEEWGGLNLYGFVGGDPLNNFDYLGLLGRWPGIEIAPEQRPAPPDVPPLVRPGPGSPWDRPITPPDPKPRPQPGPGSGSWGWVSGGLWWSGFICISGVCSFIPGHDEEPWARDLRELRESCKRQEKCRCTADDMPDYLRKSRGGPCPDRVFFTVPTGTSIGDCQAAAIETAPVECRKYYHHCAFTK